MAEAGVGLYAVGLPPPSNVRASRSQALQASMKASKDEQRAALGRRQAVAAQKRKEEEKLEEQLEIPDDAETPLALLQKARAKKKQQMASDAVDKQHENEGKKFFMRALLEGFQPPRR